MDAGGIDWKWAVGLAVTLGLAIGAGVWGAVKGLITLVAQLTTEATEIKVQLRLVVPIAQEMPSVKQTQAVHEHRLTVAEDKIEKIDTKVSQ